MENLAKHLNIEVSGAHDALCDVIMLKKVIKNLKIKYSEMLKMTLPWNSIVEKNEFSKDLPKALKRLNLNNLKTCTSSIMRNRMVTGKISFEMIIEAYRKNKINGLLSIFGNDEN